MPPALSMRAVAALWTRTAVRANTMRVWVAGAIIKPVASGVQDPARFCAPEARKRTVLPRPWHATFFGEIRERGMNRQALN